ncbi:response regulator transcription factor [Culicoidibacter larvae]|uniref:Response regulator transcription factor n=1 Tax=Culicoidibacter larvae TaxID=2579976 RepID=A0A5R8Q862_9FIRM|nr:response regulator transcription factor [Culicoidibacter larvae]TLG71767.1 response regulator transcription factor [Culicoidibacter larvae]
MKRILHVEDNEQYREFIAGVLKHEGYEVISSDNAMDGIKLFELGNYDLVITDLKMKNVDGLQFFSFLRRIDPEVKVIVLTGSNRDADEVAGLEMMVNDYIKKPVSVEVLLTRIARVISENRVLRVDTELYSEPENLRIDIQKRKVYKDDELVVLTSKEYELLVYLMRNKGRVITREELLKEVWRQSEDELDIRNVDTYIKRLRTKLVLSTIYSVRSVGYEWVE